MKILFVNRSARAEGGAELYLHSLARRMGEKGCASAILCRDASGGDGFPGKSFAVPSLWDEELVLAGGAKKAIDGLLAETAPDAVFVHNIANGKAIEYLAAKARTLAYVHDYKFVDPDGKMLLHNPLEPNRHPLSPGCFFRAYTRKSMPRNPVKGMKAYMRARAGLKAIKRLDKVMVASGYMEQALADNGVDKGRITVLPYFIDYADGSRGSGMSSNRILFAGRLADGKGLDLLLEALKKVKNDFHLDVAGRGPMEEVYRAKVRELGLSEKVSFLGWVDREGLAGLYGTARLIVVPSAWPEPFGICGIEAAFFGKPAVAFAVGGISDWLIDGETGFLVRPYDKEDMAAKIGHLLNNPDMARGLGARARELAIQKYNPDKHIEKLLKIFNG